MVMTNTWEKTKLGDVAQFTNGGPWKQSEYTNLGIPVVRVSDFENGSVSMNKCKYLSRDVFEKYKKHVLHEGDLVVATVGSHPTQPASMVGKPAIIPREADGALLNQNAVRITSNNASLSKKYLQYLGFSDAFRNYIISCARGTASQVRMSIGLFKKMPVHLPPKLTQIKTGEILSKYDALIKNHNSRIKILEEMAQAIYTEWFVNFRFPGYENVKFVDSELGKIPEGWKVQTVGDAGKIYTGKTPSKKREDFYSDFMPFIKTPDMHGNMFITKTNEYLSKEGANSQTRITLPKNSICVSCIGTAGVVSITTENSQTNQQINSIILTDEQTLEFMYFTLKNLEKTVKLFGATGATMTNLSKTKFMNLKFVSVDKDLTSDFHNSTFPMFQEILNLQIRNENLIKTRDLLIPKLISGEIDVSELDIDVEEKL